MPFRKVRKVVRRRRYGTRSRFVTRSLATRDYKVPYSRLGNRGVHTFKRYGATMMLGNSGNAVAWTKDNSLNVTTPSSDDFGTVQLGGAFRFMLSSVLENTDFSNLFDRYKLTGVKLKILFQSNISGVSGVGARSLLPIMNYSFDGDDATAPPGRNTIQVKTYCKEKILNGNRPFSIYIKPRISKLVYAGLTTSAYSSEKPVWLDMNNMDVEHYGLKFWINNWLADTDASSQKLTIQPIYYFACRDTQ